MRSFAIPVVVVSLAALLVSGCASSAAGPAGSMLPVKGRVTYKGQPLKEGSISFRPEDDGRGAHGRIEPDGSFVLTTFKEGDGASAGIHRIAVRGTNKKGEPVPIKYWDAGPNDTKVTVGPETTEYSINLK